VANALGYRPNRAAKNLAGGRTSVIGLVLGTEQLHADLYAVSLLQAVLKAAEHHDEDLMLIGDSHTPGIVVQKLILDGLIDGVIISAVALGDAWVEELIDTNLPTVLVGAHPPRPDMCVVDVENIASSATVVGHMLDTGCSRVAILNGLDSRFDVQLRFAGYLQAHAERNLAPDPRLEFVGDFSRRSGYEAADAVLAAKPDAVFCGNDEMAVGLHMAFAERGIAIPGDISMAGFDRTAADQFGLPKLTSVGQPFGELGLKAFDSLNAIIGGERPESLSIAPEIYWGETTQPRTLDMESVAAASAGDPSGRFGEVEPDATNPLRSRQ